MASAIRTSNWHFWMIPVFTAHPLQFACTAESRNVSADCCLRSSAIPLLVQLFTRTDFRHAFLFSAPSVWDLLPQSVLISTLSVSKSRLKTFCVNQAFYWTVFWPVASASEVINVWHYRHVIMMIIIIITEAGEIWIHLIMVFQWLTLTTWVL